MVLECENSTRKYCYKFLKAQCLELLPLFILFSGIGVLIGKWSSHWECIGNCEDNTSYVDLKRIEYEGMLKGGLYGGGFTFVVGEIFILWFHFYREFPVENFWNVFEVC